MERSEQPAEVPSQDRWNDDGRFISRDGKHFGRWWVSEQATLTDEGVQVEYVFQGYQPNERGDITLVHGLEAAREFAAQLLAAIEYASSEPALGVQGS